MESSQRWYLLRSKPNQDKRAQQNLEQQGFCVYRPQAIIKTKQVSLFPGYLFIQIDIKKQDVAPIRSTMGVLGLVRFGAELAQVPESVIDYIKTRSTDTAEKLVRLSNYQKGDKVRINEGVLNGYEAIFDTYDGTERVVLLLNMMQKQQRITLPVNSVQ